MNDPRLIAIEILIRKLSATDAWPDRLSAALAMRLQILTQ